MIVLLAVGLVLTCILGGAVIASWIMVTAFDGIRWLFK